MTRALQYLPLVLILASCGSSAGTSDAQNAAATASAARSPKQPPATNPTFKLGVNVSTINSWDGNRPFMNLIYGSSWQMQNTSPSGGYEEVPATLLDANGWVKSLPAGYRIVRGLSIPQSGGNFVCRYQGNGSLNVEGSAVSDVTSSAGQTRFTLATTYPNAQGALLTFTVDPANYIRNIDCRETTSATTDVIAPEFASAIAGFKVLRFMEWQTATATNAPVTWTTRNKPGDGDYLKNDGVPVELIVQTANQAGSDAWVTIPWYADNDYITHFASYVRDNLAPGHQVYVEVSNEVWNGGAPIATIACNEAKAENLPGVNGGTGCNLERYAEKTKQVMAIWSSVFSGQTSRLVRVASFQHVATYWPTVMLPYMNLYQSVDAMATAPYFGYDIGDGMTLDQIMAALPGKAMDTVNAGVQQLATAKKYNLRYITYEGGQHVVLPNNVDLLRQVERDPRMYDVYKQFITSWQGQIGDNLNLFLLTGGISQYGGWGLSEYTGQPLTDAPKLRAVRDVIAATSGKPIKK
jgi:hypothetical protein